MAIELQVGGFGYAGMAGSNGDRFVAQETGPESEAVFYRKQGIAAGLSKIGIDMFGSHYGKAYITRAEKSSLHTAGVLLTEEAVKGAGMGDYVLWEMAPGDRDRHL